MLLDFKSWLGKFGSVNNFWWGWGREKKHVCRSNEALTLSPQMDSFHAYLSWAMLNTELRLCWEMSYHTTQRESFLSCTYQLDLNCKLQGFFVYSLFWSLPWWPGLTEAGSVFPYEKNLGLALWLLQWIQEDIVQLQSFLLSASTDDFGFKVQKMTIDTCKWQ